MTEPAPVFVPNGTHPVKLLLSKPTVTTQIKEPSRVERVMNRHKWMSEEDARLVLVMAYKSFYETEVKLGDTLENHMEVATKNLETTSGNKVRKLVEFIRTIIENPTTNEND